jgi:hypothetical protein
MTVTQQQVDEISCIGEVRPREQEADHISFKFIVRVVGVHSVRITAAGVYIFLPYVGQVD